MTGSIISKHINKTVTLGSAGYTGPLTISSSGTIDPTAGGATGLYVPASVTNATILNNGEIFGAAAASGGNGGIAVLLNAVATLSNGDIIEGGYGGNTGKKGHGLQGGIGIAAFAADTGSITNTGLVIGGGGGGGYTYGGTGGAGVLIDGATLTNTANGFTGIIGGAGGASFYDGGNGGIGVVLDLGVVVNNAVIKGGAGGYQLAGQYPGYGAGGAGVVMLAGTLTNGAKGGITGGNGGQGAKNARYGGNGGNGVDMYGGSVSNLGVITGGAGGAIVNTNIYDGTGGAGGNALEVSEAGATLTNTGTIIGGLGGYGNYRGGAGGAGAAVYNGAAVTNAGLIIGGAGATSKSYGGAGDYGVIVKYATFSSSGSVRGGGGGSGYDGRAQDAGTNGGGAYIGHSSLTNSGTITAGNGAIGLDAHYSVLSNAGRIAGGYAGGQGMALGGASTMANTGTIIGGAGEAQLYNGGGGGLGVYMLGGATLTNSKLLAGGAGGYGDYYNGRTGYGGSGGTGVLISNAVLINAGTISGGAGGGGNVYGTRGDAVAFSGAGTLVVENGGEFIGNVVADASYSDVLELAGTSSTALTGIGAQFSNFNEISFASGAAWTIAGSTIGLASGAEIDGFAAGDVIVVDGFSETGVGFTGAGLDLFSPGLDAEIALGTSISGDLLITSDGTNSTLSVKTSISSTTITSGQADLILARGTASKISVIAGGQLLADDGGKVTSVTLETSGVAQAISGGAMFHTVVDKKATLYVQHGGSATSTTIDKGGLEYVVSGGVSTDTTINGGTLDLVNSGGVAGKLTFKGTGGVLIVDQTEIPTTVISGFKAGDKVLLLDAASDLGTVTVTKANVVTISADGKTYKLNIAGAKVGETNFKFSGFALTETAAKMAIQRPAEPGGTPAAHALPELVAAGGYQSMAATPPPPSQWTASAAAYAGPMHELIRVPHGGIQTMVTLQSG